MRWLVPLLLLLLLMPGVPHPAAQESGVPTSLEIQVHQLINGVRADKDRHHLDLVPLQLHSVLIDVARKHSQDMLDRNYFAHIDPDGKSPADRVQAAGVTYTAVGENLYYSSGIPEDQVAQSAVDGWVNSPGHYANIIGDYTFTGIGIIHHGDVYYITQVFITADPGHMASIGTIYDNNHLSSLQRKPATGGFHLSTQTATGLVILLVILIGIDANRRNRRYYTRS